MTIRKPNLFIIGAHKAGSSALWRNLMSHPQIFMCKPKEPSYFVIHEELRVVYPSMAAKGFWQSEEHYLRLFEGAGDCPFIGEGSVNYTRLNKVTGVAERIHNFNPHASLIYIMRDPIERTISHYWYMVNMFGETRNLRRAVEEDPDYQDTSHYAFQLRNYLKYFNQDKIFTLTTERFRTEPDIVIGEICDWLGIEKVLWKPPEVKIVNPTPQEVRQVKSWAALHGMRHSALWNRVLPFIPKFVLTPVRFLTEKRVPRRTVPIAPTIEYLRPIQSRQTDALSRLLGREFPEWRTLHPKNGS